ncbi:MAG: ATP-binding protein [Hespellia sp.]|nr:ATP-binding protein [Hespellia sp.]
MKKKKTIKKRIWTYVGILLAICLLGGLSFTVWSVWREYSQSILDMQKEQMSNTVDSIAASLEHEITTYAADVEQLCSGAAYSEEQQNPDNMKFEISQYLVNRKGYVDEVTLRDKEGNIIYGQEKHHFTDTYKMCSLGNGITFSEQMDKENRLYFVFTKKTESGMQVELDVSVRKYYDDIISNIKIGTNGYVVVKTSNGVIVMHPEEEQWGMNVIEGREAFYQVDELESLELMTEKQMAGETGVAEYDSYWWGNPSLPKVRKISAYTPAYVGDDYLVVSAVIDYDEVYNPIFAGFTKIGVIFSGFFLVILCFLGVFSYLAFQKKKNQEEIEYLRDLNQVLEETKQSEEVITHQQRLQIMGTMTGGIAHEFNNMLTPIMGYADMLLDMLPEESIEYDYVHEIFEASDRAKDVIQQISSLSRKNMETVFSFISVKKLLKRTMKMVNSVCPVNVHIDLDEQFSREGFLGNETQMKQVILNLCVNAFHAIGKDQEGKLSIFGTVEEREQIEDRHKITLANEWNSYICIRISDNGSGMSQETMEQIFTPFFTTKKTGKGTGLGLSVAEQIIHSHKGYICVTSRLSEGSTFYIYLPGQEDRPMEQIEAEHPTVRAKRVLVVDDNEKILELLRKEFERIKIEITATETPGEAKEALENFTYQFILIDQTLGENYSGINFAMSIQNQYPDMIRILMVDQVKKEVIEAIQQNSIDAYVEKPVSAASILEKIRSLNEEDAM